MKTMKTTVSACETTFNLTAVHSQSKDGHCGGRNAHYRVYVSSNGERTAFDFFQSIANPVMKNERDILFAFQCFVSDAINGHFSYEVFCSEFGYDENRESKRIYNACKLSAKKLEKFDVDNYDLYNEMQEKYDL
jgi:hypothetical protein